MIHKNYRSVRIKLEFHLGFQQFHKKQNEDQTVRKSNREKISETMRKVNGKKVSQYTKDGEFIASFDSIIEGAEKNGLTRGNVQACVSGRTKKAGGFIWKYAEPKDISLVEQQNQEGSQLAL
jgi:hypothetical protein